jgi:energy-coupling factor transport system permease protein
MTTIELTSLRPLPRLLHPAAWWLWALCLAYCAMRTDNVLLLLAIGAVTAVVVSQRRSPGRGAGAYGLLLKLGLLTVITTMLLQLLVGVRNPGHVLATLPSVSLPSWLQGLSVGGAITGEAMLNAFVAGLRLAVLIACFGAANALAHPARLARILPAALYEVGVAVVVALTFVPQLAEAATRVRTAQRLRGRRSTGFHAVKSVAVPVLAEAMERAIALAASMDSRGYGRRAAVPRAQRTLTTSLLLLGLGGAVLGTYQVIENDGSSHLGGIALLVGGTALALLGGFAAGRRGTRTRYRPDRWGLAETFTLACGLVVALTYRAVIESSGAGVAYAWPTLPIGAFAVTLIAALPAVLTPAPPTAGLQ